MVPLAVSGTIVLFTAISLACLLIFVLLRGEARFEERERRAQEQRAALQEPQEPEA